MVGLLLLACLMRFYHIGDQALWLDEILQLQLSQASPDVIVSHLRTLPLGPAYTLLLKAWMGLAGTSELAVRFIPASAGVVSVALFYKYLRIWLLPPAAIVGGLLLALSPFHLYFSQEGRPYTLVVALILATLLVFHRLLQEHRKRWIVLHSVLLALTGYSHYTALIVFGGEAIWTLAAYARDAQRWRRVLVSWGLALFALIWIVPDALQALRSVYGSYDNSLDMLSTIQTIAAGFGKYAMFTVYEGTMLRTIAPLALLSLIVLALPTLKSARVVWAIAAGAIGLQFGWTFLFLPLTGSMSNPSFNERHFLWMVPFALSIAALGFEYALQSHVRLVRMAGVSLVIVTLALYVVGNAGYFQYYVKNVARMAVEFVVDRAHRDDLIVHNTRAAATSWDIYGDPQLTAWDKPMLHDDGWRFSSQVGFVFGEQIQWTHAWQDVARYPRVWVFYLAGQGPPELMSSLRSIYPEEQTWTFGNVEVFLFDGITTRRYFGCRWLVPDE